MKKTAISTALAATLLLAGSVTPSHAATFTGAAKDAWITGRIETAFVLNAHLNPFAITTDVKDGHVHLSGMVKDGIDRDLAAEVARGVDGVTSVKNDLKVDPKAVQAKTNAQTAEHRSFGAWVDDATMTARVKSRLLANDNVHALKIDVDTKDRVVTLSGRVASREEKALAEQIARNANDVKSVRNNLVVDPS